jgi:fluoride ion exporter CrcB/FEX
MQAWISPQPNPPVVLIGFLGGFTTFSSFGLQTFAL